MKFTTEWSDKDRYLSYHFERLDIIETMSFGQLANNTIPGLVPATVTQRESETSIFYQVTSVVPLDEYLKKPIRKAALLKIFSNILCAVSSAQEYMIGPETMLFDRKYTFLDPKTLEVSLICLPIADRSGLCSDLQAFLWKLVAKTVKDKSENREYVSDLMEKLDSEESLSIDDMKRILKEFEPNYQSKVVARDRVAEVQTSTSVSSAVQMQIIVEPEATEQSKEDDAQNRPAVKGHEYIEAVDLIDKKKTNVVEEKKDSSEEKKLEEKQTTGEQQKLPARGNVTVLEMHQDAIPAGVKTIPCLVRERGNEVARIEGTVYQIGSDYGYCDYHVKNNRTVSSIHAQIVRLGNDFYIKDMNSKCRTFLDEKPIPAMEDIKLEHGTRIRLGTERFIFTLY